MRKYENAKMWKQKSTIWNTGDITDTATASAILSPSKR